MLSMVRMLVLASLTLSTFAQADERAALFDSAWIAWHQSDFRTAYTQLALVRELPYGRQPIVDFMLGTSACRIETVRDYGARLLDWLLYAYALSADSRRLVAHERDICRSAPTTAVPTRPGQIVELRSAGMTAVGKTFYWAASEQQPVDSYPIRRIRDMPREAFAERLVALGEEAGAAALARSLAPGARTRVSSRFMLMSHGVHDDRQLEEIGRTLDRFVGYLVATYGVLAPPHYIRIELVRDGWQVKQLAEQRHALDASSATIGYAFVDDGSIVAAVPTAAAGTVLHELFHLLTRSNFGDIPQWLDEGIAALYEVSGRRENVYFGLDNWRRLVLENTWHYRPDIATLIRSEWFLFDDPVHVHAFESGEPAFDLHDRSAGARQAAMMAMARYFALYLQQQGKLAEIYAAMRDLGFAQLEGAPADHALTLVEAALGASSAEIDRRFVAWFQGERPAAPVPRVDIGEVHVTTSNVNVRTGPGTGYERLTTLGSGTRVGVTEAQGEWRRVELEDGTTAYINAGFLRPER